jgi:outer membrane protein TolC
LRRPPSGFRLPAAITSILLGLAAVPLRAQTPPASIPSAPSPSPGPELQPPQLPPPPSPPVPDVPAPLGGDETAERQKPKAEPGLTLAQLKERARLRDPRAEQAQAQMLRAQAKSDEVAWMRFPTIEATLGFGGPTPEAKLVLGDNDPNLTDITPGTRDGWGKVGFAVRVQGTATLPLYTFGKLENGRRAAEHGVGFSEAMLQRARDQAVFDVTRAFWGYQTAHAGVISVDSVRKRLSDAQKTAKELLDEGSDQVTRNDALKLDYLKEEIEAQYAGTVKNERLAFNGIRAVIGAAPDEKIEISRQQLPPAPEMPDRARMMARALERRSETKAAREGVLARQRLVDVERGKLYPDLALVGGGTFTYTSNASNPHTPFAYNPYNERTAFMALALRGTFDVPQKLARLRQTEADLREAEALARGAQQLIRLEVESALNDLEEARTKVARYTRETEIGKHLAIKAAIAFEGGLGTARELLEDTLLFARADGARLTALFEAQMAWASLEKAVGGL